VISGFLTLGYAALVAVLMRKSQLPAEYFGFTCANFWRSMFAAFCLSSSIIAVMIAVKMLLLGENLYAIVGLLTQFSHHQMQSTHFIFDALDSQLTRDGLLVYILVIAPAQELIVRSGLQSLFAAYLHTRYRNAFSIILANFIFCSSHFVYGSILLVALTFLLGILISIMFVYYRSFWAAAFTHSLVGTVFLLLFY